MIRMLVLDLDETLLRTDKTISSHTQEVLKKAQKAGIKIVFATARPYRAIKHLMDQVSCDTAVYHNGASALLDGVRVENSYSIPVADAVFILQTLKARYPGKKLAVEINDKIHSNFDVVNIWGKTQKEREILEATTVWTDFSDLPQIDADKIIIEINSEKEYDEIKTLMSADMYAQLSDGKTLCLVMHRDATKLNAVKRLAMILGVARDEMAAFGDDYNDVEMIRYCGTGVAMGNAIEEVRKVADAVTATNNEDGVAKYIMENIFRMM
jgi:Cof subfamily protein (haloacid dehalogenase superfamily)